AIILGLQSVYGFITQGGRRVNASSAAVYGIILFAIFPALYASRSFTLYAKTTDIESLIITLVLAGVLQTLLLTVCPPRKAQQLNFANHRLSTRTGTLAIILLAMTFLLRIDILNPLQSAFGILAIFFAAFSAVTSESRTGLLVAAATLATAVV